MTVTVDISVTDPTDTEKQAIASLLGITSISGGTTGTVTPPVDYFPADPATAPFPSPEGSRILIQNGAATGQPYILDKSGVVYSFGSPPVSAPVGGNVYGTGLYWIYANGVKTAFAADEIIICQQIMWYHAGVKWFYISASGGGAGNVTSLPPFYTSGSGSSATPTMPAAPAIVSPAPGSTGVVVKAGPTETNTTLAAALTASAAGGTVSLDAATFAESVAVAIPLQISGGGTMANAGLANAAFSGLAIIDGSSLADPTGYAHQLGGIVPMTDVIIDGVEVTGFGLKEATGGGTGGVRNGAASNVVVRNCYIHDNQDGIFSGGFATTFLVENCLLQNNGLGGGQTHNVYLSTGVVSATFKNVTSIVPPQSAAANRTSGLMNGGHAIKSRANVTTITGGYFYSADATPIDIPDGSTQLCVISGATIEKKAGDANHGVFGYGVESQSNGMAGVMFIGCTFILNCDAPFFQTMGGTITFDSTCVWQGTKPTVSGGGTVVGLPK